METANISSTFQSQIDQSNIKHILLNLSESETTIKHPDLPEGFICRDQFQAQAFAGTATTIWSGGGSITSISEWNSIYADNVTINTKDLANMTFNGKSFTKDLFNSTPVATVKLSLTPYSVIGPGTLILDSSGAPCTVTGLVGVTTLLGSEMIFTSSNSSMLPPHVEVYQYLNTEMGL